MSKNLKLLLILFAVMALILGLWVGKHKFNKPPLTEGQVSTIISPPQDIAPFTLVDSKGRPFNNDSLWGHWTFLFFGFTNCASICPPAMSNLNKLYNILLQEKQNPMPQVVFISVDPERDTLKKIGEYVTSFNPHFEGATGDKAAVDSFASSLSVLYIKVLTDKKTGDYTFDHSGAILLVDPQGKLIAIFSMPHDPVLMAKDFHLILDNSG